MGEINFDDIGVCFRLKQLQTNRQGVMNITTPSRSSQKVSTFHSSKIQCSSTPVGQRVTSGVLDMSHALQEAYETPIRGHRLRKSVSSNKAVQRSAVQKRVVRCLREGSD